MDTDERKLMEPAVREFDGGFQLKIEAHDKDGSVIGSVVLKFDERRTGLDSHLFEMHGIQQAHADLLPKMYEAAHEAVRARFGGALPSDCIIVTRGYEKGGQ